LSLGDSTVQDQKIKVNLINAIDVFEKAWNQTHDFGANGRKCRQLIGKYMFELCKSYTGRKKFMNLSQDALRALLQSDYLHVRQEYDILLMVGAWAIYLMEKKRDEDIKAGKSTGFGPISLSSPSSSYKLSTTSSAKGKEKVEEDDDDDADKGLNPIVEEMICWLRFGREKRMKKDDGTIVPAVAISGSGFGTSVTSGTVAPSTASGTDADADADAATEQEDVEEDEDLKKEFKIDPWKTSEEFKKQLSIAIEPFVPHIRFPQMVTTNLDKVEQSNLVPRKYFTEAFKHIVLSRQTGYKTDPANERMRRRRYRSSTWDDTRKGSNILLHNDKRTVSKLGSCSHTTIITKDAITSGSAIWRMSLKSQAGCYSAVGVCSKTFNVNSDILGVANNSWGYAMYSGMGNIGGRRTQTSGIIQAGTQVMVELDRDAKKIVFF